MVWVRRLGRVRSRSHFDRLGITPGQSLRGKEWQHRVLEDGRRVAAVWVAIKLTARDLLAQTEESTAIPDTVPELLSIV